MKCPYAVNSTRVNQWKYEYDAEGRGSFTELVERECDLFVECLKDECAVFRDGKCNFRCT